MGGAARSTTLLPSRAVFALLLAGVGVCLLVAGGRLLQSLGTPYRIGRILAAASPGSISDALLVAQSGRPTYLRVRGRLRSAEEFPDEHDRPLVFRRRTLEALEDDRWRVLDEERLAVPFGLEERSSAIDVDIEALGEGLVVMPRESVGRAGEVRAHVPAGIPDGSLVRLRIDQLSAVEQVYACGVPRIVDGRPTLTAGLGRPLIVCSLELPEAMRVLSGGRRREALVGGACLLGGLAALVGSIVALLADL